MRVVYVSFGYHPNQHPIIKTLQSRGHQIKYLIFSTPEYNEYSAIKPTLVGYDEKNLVIDQNLSILDLNTKVRLKYPKITKLNKNIRDFDPDIVVIRNYELYSIAAVILSRFHGYSIVIRDQIPVCRREVSRKKRILSNVHNSLFDEPIARISPVQGDCESFDQVEDEFYIPFTYDPQYVQEYNKKEYFKSDTVNIVNIGKFRQPRKNHELLIKSVSELNNNYNISLKLIGKIDDKTNNNYQRIIDSIEEEGIEEIVEIKPNISYSTVQKELFESDIFVLPSRNEPAAVSVLEAMTQGLPVISSDSNGTSCYINQEYNGYVLENIDSDILTEHLKKLVSNRSKIRKMGKHSYELALKNHSPELYCRRFEDVINRIKNK